jgi:hypothetical protein
MRKLELSIAVIVTLSTWVAASAPSPTLQTAEEVVACNEANLPRNTSVQSITMKVTDRAGSLTTTKATIYWKRFKNGESGVVVRLFEPDDVRGSAFMMLEKKKRNDLFLYLPELGRVKRVSAGMMSTSLFGTDISYEDFEHMQSMSQAERILLETDTTVNGRPSYLVEVRPPKSAGSAYERILTYIDQETCAVLRAEYFERGEQVRKVFSADAASLTSEADGVWIARRYVVRDERDATQTAIVIDEVEIDKPISRKMFTERELVRGGR